MVKEMSKQVQFIYITHIKIAMEMADQLMGVTMHEPGCSRLGYLLMWMRPQRWLEA